uniref:Uncharacterized protein n=1 Tax=Rhizophora mucronata TaxID=61149 RepID=A0A2P2NWU0_RHIMU
MRIYLLRNLL